MVTLSARDWPPGAPSPHPGDLRRFLSPPLQDEGLDPYWKDDRTPVAFTEPLHLAPLDAGAYGTLYFDRYGREGMGRFFAACRVLDVDLEARDYVAYRDDHGEPQTDRYLEQLRLVGTSALIHAFRALAPEDAAALPAQQDSVGAALRRFIEDAIARYGTGYSRELSGSLGGDGDWAKEALSFGFMVESAPHKVYRIWTRPWLVTK